MVDMDIVERLRSWPCMGLDDAINCSLCEAADEIERLREEVFLLRILKAQYEDKATLEKAQP